MRIAISLLSYRPGRIGGTETYIKKLLQYFPEVSHNNSFVCICNSENKDLPELHSFEKVVVNTPPQHLARQHYLEHFTSYRNKTGYDAIVSARPNVVFYPQRLFPRRTAWPSVFVVHDLHHDERPGDFPLVDRWFRRRIHRYSLQHASRVISISKSVSRSVLRRHSIAPSKISVIHHGFDPLSTQEVVPYPYASPYIYFPAGSFPNKGHLKLLESFSELVKRGRCAHHLVLTGLRDDYWIKIQRRIQSLGLASHVTDLGFVPYSTVLQLYKGADAVVFPSDFEGFGLPVIESYSFAKKVITSRLEIFDELGVPSEDQIDFGSADELGTALSDLSFGAQVRPYDSWQETAKKTLEILLMASHT